MVEEEEVEAEEEKEDEEGRKEGWKRNIGSEIQAKPTLYTTSKRSSLDI